MDKLKQKMMALFLKSHTFKEIVESGEFEFMFFTSGMKSIPKPGGCRLETCSEIKDAKSFDCEKVVTHKDGSFSCMYNGMWVRFSNVL